MPVSIGNDRHHLRWDGGRREWQSCASFVPIPCRKKFMFQRHAGAQFDLGPQEYGPRTGSQDSGLRAKKCPKKWTRERVAAAHKFTLRSSSLLLLIVSVSLCHAAGALS
jgi:hypothetical protein